MLVLRIWLIMSLADFRLAALQSQECGRPAALDSNVTDFHTWVRLPDDPDDLIILMRLVTWLMMLNTW